MSCSFREAIQQLSARLVKAQYPIRILDSIQWPESVKNCFFESNYKKLPHIDREFYQHHSPLRFDPRDKMTELLEIKRSIKRLLGSYSGVGGIMQRMCEEYIRVIDMLKSRGTSKFTEISQELYGSAQDRFYPGGLTLQDLAEIVNQVLNNFSTTSELPIDQKIFSSEEAVVALNNKLSTYFSTAKIKVEVSDGIIADASAGAECIKLRSGIMFSQREINLLEIHEGWVHLGTTLNGLAQPICTFLSKGPPSATVTQEGLGMLMEIFTFLSYPKRVKFLTNRITAVSMSEAGADFFEIFEFYRHQDFDENSAYNAAVRVFRGSTPNNGPFTKDLSYCKGFVLIYQYICLAVKRGFTNQIPLLFLGKTTLEDLPILADLVAEKIIEPPKYLPPQFQDIAALSAWICYSLFFNQLSLAKAPFYFKSTI